MQINFMLHNLTRLGHWCGGSLPDIYSVRMLTGTQIILTDFSWFSQSLQANVGMP
jgi:hypothetical protein